jgi:ribosomal protein L11 methyltransferase
MNTDESWLALEITVLSEAIEAIEFALNEIGALGTEINLLGKREPQETICVNGYFNQKPNADFIRNELTDALRIYGFSGDTIKKLEWHKVENRDWLAEWKKHWKPTETGKLIIAPSWEKIENTEKIVIRIEPNMAFGTGTHETTRLCLKAIEENYLPEMSFLDVGTGTGILAIAAAKFKVQSSKFKAEFSDSIPLNFESETLNSIWACDTDENSIKIAVENVELNNCENINFYVGSIGEETPKFDFVCANLTVNVIVPLLPLLIEKTEMILVLSGILSEQENFVAEKLNELGISDFKVETDGEWISLKFSRRQ